MDIERIARKLEPLMPREVARWLKIHDTADPEMKSLIEKQIVMAAHRRLGDFREKILLSLPSEQRARGPIHLGTVCYDRLRWSLGLTTAELLQNLAIFGRSGAGKTNVVFHLIEQLTDRGIAWLFLDWKRTARHLIPRLKAPVNVYTPGRALLPFSFNPFIVPPQIERNVYIVQLVDVMAEAYTLGDGARSILQAAIAACYAKGNESPWVADVIREVEAVPDKQRVSAWKTTALRALHSMAFSQVAGTARASQEEQAKALLEGNTIIELDALSDSTKQFLVPILSLWIYSVKLVSREREKLNLVIIIEEAHHVLYRQESRSKESLMNRLLRQCREIGIGIVVVDQHPHLISSAALGNTYTSICLNLKDPSDINRAAGLSQVPEYEKHFFSMLPIGQGIVKLQDRWRRPMLLQFPHIEVAKGAVTDAVLKRILSDTAEARAAKRGLRRGLPSRIGTGDRLLSFGEFRLMHDVLCHPDDGVKARYARLGMNARLGTQLKETLVERGWLDETIVKLGKTRKSALIVTKQGEAFLGPELRELPAGSLAHDYWQRFYASMFEQYGYAVAFETPRHGGRADLLAVKDRERVAIEIETGKSDVVSNVSNGLLSAFDRIIVVATDSSALNTVERQLGKAGLLIPGRVTVVLRDGLTLG